MRERFRSARITMVAGATLALVGILLTAFTH